MSSTRIVPGSDKQWKGVSLSTDLLARIEEFRTWNPDYKSVAAVINAAVREFIDRQVEAELRRRQLLQDVHEPVPTPDEVEKARLANRRAVERARAEDERRAREGR